MGCHTWAYKRIESPSFEEMISELTNLKNKINALDWKFESEFPL